MRRLIIEYGEDRLCDVIDEYGRRCGGLGWDEMIGQIARLTLPKQAVGHGYRMMTEEEWEEEKKRWFKEDGEQQ